MALQLGLDSATAPQQSASPNKKTSVSTTTPLGTAKANTQTAPAPSNPVAPPATAAESTDWTSDPIYQLTLAQSNLAISQAKASALAQQSQALIAYGDPGLALAVTGDQNVAAAAGANKASTLAQLAASNAQTVRGTNEKENQENLFYSSDRGYQLGLDQQQYLGNQASALSSVQGNLGSIGSQLLASEQSAYQSEQQAAQDAYNRAISALPGSPQAVTPTTSTAPTTATTNQGYLSTATGQSLAAQVAAKPASAGSSGAAAVLTGAASSNTQAAKNVRLG